MDDIREDDRALLELASMIDEDQPIDWDSEEGVARGDDERAVLAELRVLAALTRVYRDPDAVGLETPLQTEVQQLVDPSHRPRRGDPSTVFEQVGKGGFAKVYRARDALGRDVALKLFPVTPENSGALSSRVLREGSLLAKISHRNVVVVHGVERSSGFVGLWMEFIHGRTMEDELARTRAAQRRGSHTHRRGSLPGARRRARTRPRPSRRQGAERDARGAAAARSSWTSAPAPSSRLACASRSTRPARRCTSPRSSSTGDPPRARRHLQPRRPALQDGDARVPGRRRRWSPNRTRASRRASQAAARRAAGSPESASSRPSSARCPQIPRPVRRRPASSRQR